MYTLSVGLGYSAISLMLEPFNDYSALFSKVHQHRIIISASIIEYYLNCVPDDSRDALETFFDDISNNDEYSHSFNDDSTLDARQNLINFVNGMQTKVLISQEEEFSSYDLGKMRRLITPSSIIADEFNDFTRYSLPLTNHNASAGKGCNYYSQWFGHLFENEERITIIDRYLFTENGKDSFEKYILPKISLETRIDIYCEVGEGKSDLSEDEIKELINNSYSGRKIHVFICDSLDNHNRYIYLRSIKISLSNGISFLHAGGLILNSCDISISKCERFKTPNVKKVL